MSTYIVTHPDGKTSTKNSKTKPYPYAVEVEVNDTDYFGQAFIVAGWSSTPEAATNRLNLVNKMVGPGNHYRSARIVETTAA